MPTRRDVIAGCAALLSSPLAAVAGGTPAAESVDGSGAAATVDATGPARAVGRAGGRPFGRVDFAALRAARREARTAADRPLDRATALDRRLAPVLGRGPDAPAGLRSLSGGLSARAALARLRALAGDDGRLRATRDGDVLATGAPTAAARAVAADRRPLSAAARRVRAALSGADAYTGVDLDGQGRGLAALVPADHPSGDALASVSAVGLGVDGTGTDPHLRAHVVAGEAFDRADAAATLGAFGVPRAALGEIEATRRDDGLAVRASLDGDRRGLGVLVLLLLLPVVGTFVLGLGDPVGQSPPQVAFSFDRTSDGRVEITHDGGDRLEAVTVAYVHDGRRVRERWSGGVGAGSRYTTARTVDSGTVLRVVWRSDGGDRATTLARYTVS